ncbi:HD domain-containing protein C4G3.17 [Cinnamomum micranthum f. kanehirae]|uniref:5'-deoxynucleotidase n=1 Tax=Cinnamomum micranthum f. kanehirae TaxID=337451 RepID=A0A443PT65_9MAGN|nr:HD domain-containing protein C4G3.17 [Cinnamomum micranthum f. kanehirae]
MAANACISPAASPSPSSSSALQRRSSPSPSPCRLYSGLGFCNRTPRIIITVRSAARDGHEAGFGSKKSLDSEDGAGPIGSSVSSSSLSPSSSSAIDFLTLCHRLKTTKRKGWINHGIKGPESIADHMYRMALMALIAGDLPGVNRERCIKIAVVHDIAEAIVGDITPSDGVPKEEKSRREREALNEMCEVLGGGMRAEEIKELWAEYENNSSKEASLVKDFDKVEMILQALEYETEHGKVLDEFFLSTAGKFQTETGRAWAAEVISRRNLRLDDRFN